MNPDPCTQAGPQPNSSQSRLRHLSSRLCARQVLDDLSVARSKNSARIKKTHAQRFLCRCLSLPARTLSQDKKQIELYSMLSPATM